MISVAILGSGNIGCDILFKVLSSPYLNCAAFIGRNNNSKGLQLASSLGVRNVSIKGIEEIIANPDLYDIVFDTTSSSAHEQHASILKGLQKKVINLTPAQTGVSCVPSIDLHKIYYCDSIDLITCGGQAAIPIVHAINQVHREIEYIEIVSSISSQSAGPATRLNIDEYIYATENALSMYSTAKKTKAILIINPAVPPVKMKVTIYATINSPNIELIKEAIFKKVAIIKKYNPNYQIAVGPIIDNDRLVVIIHIIGNGDYLPDYAGNLDIITNAAVYIAECINNNKDKECKP